MKVLVIDGDPFCTRGHSERIVWATNHFTEHEARGLFAHRRSRYAGTLDMPDAWTWTSQAEISEAIAWADVLHFLHSASPRQLGRPGILRRKPAAWHMFTLWDPKSRPKVPEWYELWQPDMHRVRRVLAAEGWQRYSLWSDDDYVILPSVYANCCREFTPRHVKRRHRRVVFAAMNSRCRPPAPKGFHAVRRRLKKNFPSKVMFREPFLECLRVKAMSWCGVDEVMTPVVHTSTFEYLALGVPVVSRHDDLTVRTVCEATGASSFPVVNAVPETLEDAVRQLLAVEPDELGERSAELRGWMDTYMNPRETIRRHVELWESL